MLPNLSESWDPGDNWGGVTDPRARRKTQNRLNQRAYRRKKHMERLGKNEANQTVVSQKSTAAGHAFPPQLLVDHHLSMLLVLQTCDIYDKVVDFLHKATANWSLRRPMLADLPALTRVNSFDGLCKNAFIMHIPVELLGSDDGNSPFLQQRPFQEGEASRQYPSHLAPTPLQRRVEHHPWLDLFPIPRLRENILAGIETGDLDEDELANGLMCDLLNLDTTQNASLVIWGDSWDIRGWEFSPDFFVKWASLLSGCEEMLEATNFWREKRKLPQLSFKLT